MMAMARDIPSAVLTQLVQQGELVLQRRCDDSADLEAIWQDVKKFCDKPAEHKRVFDDHTVIFIRSVICAARAIQQHNDVESARYARVVGVLIDDIRGDLWEAIKQQRARPTP